MAEKKQSFLLEDYIKIIMAKKKPIIIACSITALIGIALFFVVIDPVFFSYGTIRSASTGSSLSGLISSSAIPDIGDLSEIAGSTSTSKELALYENILTSRRSLEALIEKFGMMEENDYTYMQDAIKDFRENIVSIKKDRVAGTMEIGVYNKNPEKAKQMADYLIDELNKINIDLNVQSAKENREFIQGRYDLVKAELSEIEDSLIDYQNRFGIAPDLQVQAAVKADIELEAQIKAEEVKLDLLSKILSPGESEIEAQKEKINLLKQQLEESRTTSFEESNLNTKGSPQIIMNFLRLKRSVEVQNKIMTTLIPLLEKAKIDEKRETPTIVVLDKPFVPERKSKPKRITSIALMTFAVFSFSSLYFILKEKLSGFFAKLRSSI